jgi:hypothetical protein
MPTKESVARLKVKDESFNEVYQIAWFLCEEKPILRESLKKYKIQYDSGVKETTKEE